MALTLSDRKLIRALNGAIVRPYVAASAVSVGDWVYVDSADLVVKARANAVGTTYAIGMVTGIDGYMPGTVAVAGQTVAVCEFGPVAGFTGMDHSQRCDVHQSAGYCCDSAVRSTMHLNWLAWKLDHADGYGRQGLYMIQALARLGHDISPLIEAMLESPVWVQRLMGVEWSGITILNELGAGVRSLPGRVWVSSMWEDSLVLPEWVENINQHSERLLVPCAHNQQVFKLGGVTVPVHIVPLGIDPREFGPVPVRPLNKQRSYTFMALGDRGLRKGWETVLFAFSAAFPASAYPDVRLVVKTRKGETLVPFGDPRITACV